MGRLPTALASFVGRGREIADIIAQLRRIRLVTLVGFGGVGKTRLAIQVASQLHAEYSDGCVFVDLSAEVDPGMVDRAVLSALGLQESGDSVLRVLLSHLEDKQLLLVLDNCEHLTDAAGQLVTSLLRSCPQLTVLATGRAPLRVAGEQVVRVKPLALPDPAGEVVGFDHGSEALELLRERVGEQGISLEDATPRELAQLCRRLDGIPLAIELAAPWVAALGVSNLLARLDNPFPVLTDGGQRVPPHHDKMSDVVAWSAKLCTEQQQLLWQRLSVFAAEFDLDAAERVCGDDDLPRQDMLPALAGLVAQSIVLPHHGQRTYYRLLTPVRQYGLEQLQAAGHEATFRRRHGDYILALLTRGAVEVFGENETAWLAHLQRLLPEIRAAMQWRLATPGEASAAGEIACAMTDTRVWWSLGALSEGRQWLDRVIRAVNLVQPTDATLQVLLARVLAGDAWLALTQGDPAAAVWQMSLARQAADACGQPVIQDAVRVVDGVQALLGEADPRAIELLTVARDTAVRRGDRLVAHMAGLFAAIAAAVLGQNLQEAQPIIDWCIRDADAHGAGWGRWWARWPLGIALARWGSPQEALTLLREITSALHTIGDKWGMTWGMWGMALAAQDPTLAARYLGAFSRGQDVTSMDISQLGGLRALHTQLEQDIRAALGADKWQHAYEAGAAGTFDEAITAALAYTSPHTAPTGKLTPREYEIAELIGQGMDNHDIARQLVLSLRTVESHVRTILRKLEFTNRTQITRWANQNPPTPD